ncbi:MAG TPA: hypothetical protein VGM10_19085 [Actinocrinis sp.]
MHGRHAHVPAASTGHAHAHAYGPTGPGSVILELGEQIGALVLEVPPGLAGHEIEISPAAGGPRVHSMVRERGTAAGVSHAAVYPAVPAGEYTVWREDGVAAGRVAVRGGEVSLFRWSEATAAV